MIKIMDSKTKKLFLGTTIVFSIIFTVGLVYNLSNSSESKLRSGQYYCKINILYEKDTKIFKWSIGTSESNIKNEIIENEFNSGALNNFRSDVSEISIKRFTLFTSLLYITYILVIFITVQKFSELYKKEKIIIIILVIFVIFEIATVSLRLNFLYKDALYYFSVIK